MAQHTPTVGILAYGSLIDEPGDELTPFIKCVIRDVQTPFPVEFARKSSSRGDAPTLVPYDDGAPVSAAILIVDTLPNAATDMLWRRETRSTDITLKYPGPRPHRRNAVQVERVCDFVGVDIVIYAGIAANVTPLTPEYLAELAVASVAKAEPGRDGISYLAAAKGNGIVTPLSPAYEAEILRMTEAPNLQQALKSLRAR